MIDPLVQQELDELAHVVQVPAERLEYLTELGVDDLHLLRKAVTAHLHPQYSADYRRLAMLVRFLPKGMAARVGVKMLPPRIVGRSAARVFDRRAGRLLPKMHGVPAVMIAEAAPYMDPRTLGNIAAVISTDSRQLVNGIMDELIRRDDLATLDRVLLYMGEEQEIADGMSESAIPGGDH